MNAENDRLPRLRVTSVRLPLALVLPMLLSALWLSVGRASAASFERAAHAGVLPGDDFFAFANRAWLDGAAIPAGKERWGVREELEAQSRRRMSELLADAASAPPGSPARRIADFLAAYGNEAAIEARGLGSLRPSLERIAGVSDRTELARLLARGMRADVDPLGFGVYASSTVLGLAVEQSIHGEKNNVAFLVQGGLGLPDREDYRSADPDKAALRERYWGYVRNLLSLAGFANADERASAVLALETALAAGQASRQASANDHNADTVWPRAAFARRAPGLDWNAFFEAAGLGGEAEIAVWQPTAVTALAAEVAARPLAAWQDYLRFHALDEAADVLPRAFADAAGAFRAGLGTPLPPRAERALAATQAALREEIGRLYAERYFPAATKAHAESVASAVRAALLARVGAATWMSDATRASALEKLRTVYVGLGYPDRWEDGAELAVDPADPLGNLLRVAERDQRRALARLGRPVDLEHWFIAPQTVGALLVFQQNAYVMSAALLEPPKFDASSDAAAFGSLGSLIGHDLTHYIDLLGAEYDTDHRLRHWWTAEDLERFQALAQPLADQFAAYRPLPGLAIDGKLTLGENLADLGGLVAAFDAYRATLGARAHDRDVVRAQDREFFLAYARTQRRRIGESALRKQIQSSDHAPEDSRAATVRNLDAWYEAFDVRPGQRLYLEPEARVHVW